MTEFRHSREMFSAPEIPEDPEKTRQREQAAVEGFAEHQKGKDTPEWQEHFGRIDFPLLKKCLAKIAARGQIAEDKMNFVDSDRVFLNNHRYPDGQYFPDTNIISIYDRKIDVAPSLGGDDMTNEGSKQDVEKGYGNLDMNKLSILAHEETHALSRNVCVGWIQDHKNEVSLTDQSGYDRFDSTNSIQIGKYARSKHSPSRLFRALNEGVVEKLSREVAVDYMEEAGWDARWVRSFKKTMAESPDKLVYSVEVLLVDVLTSKLAEKSGQHERVAWEAIIQGLLHGETFEESEVVALFEESFGPDFLNELSVLNTQSQIDNTKVLQFIKKYNLRELDSNQSKIVADAELREKILSDEEKLRSLFIKQKEGESFTKDDLIFLYERDARIKYPGYRERLFDAAGLRKQRDLKADFSILFDYTPEQIASTPDEVNDHTRAYIGKLTPSILHRRLEENLGLFRVSEDREIHRRELFRESIEMGGRSGEEWEQELQQAGIHLSQTATDWLKGPGFFADQKDRVTLISLTVADLGFDVGGVPIDQIFQRAHEFGLELCPAEVAPPYCRTYLNKPIKDEWTYVGMEQVDNALGRPGVLRMSHQSYGVQLGDMDYDQWQLGHRFIFQFRPQGQANDKKAEIS